ncbi:MAG: hypothetical protein WBW73_15680, partial [Rhodoplanes sp.]
EGGDGLLLRFGHPDLLQRALGLAVQALRQLVEDVRRLKESVFSPAAGPLQRGWAQASDPRRWAKNVLD